MPLLDPLNDGTCLSKLHHSVGEFIQTDKAHALASQFASVRELIAYIRRLKQRDDLGDPRDGPRLSCEVTQRLRLPALDPNCFERLALFLALALLIDPSLDLTSATMMLDSGMHSFPVEIRDGVPRAVVLDPITTPLRNAMTATAYQLRNASPLARSHLSTWFSDMARNACIEAQAEDCYQVAMDAIRRSLLTGKPIRQVAEIDTVLALAGEDAQLYGALGRTAFDRVRHSIRNLSTDLDTRKVAEFLTSLTDKAEPLAGDAIKAALIAKYGAIAAIALEGANLAVGKPKKQPSKPSKPNRTKKQTHHTHHQHLRRMTLAFRPPKPQED